MAVLPGNFVDNERFNQKGYLDERFLLFLFVFHLTILNNYYEIN